MFIFILSHHDNYNALKQVSSSMETNLTSKCQVLLRNVSREFPNQWSHAERHIKGLARNIII